MLHYKKYLNKEGLPWVTFVHGIGGSLNIWYKQIKEFKKHYNFLLIDLKGHGKSKIELDQKTPYSFQGASKDIIEVLDELKIKTSHFIGISLGSIIVRNIGFLFPERVDSTILGGMIYKFNLRAKILLTIGHMTKRFLPYMFLYKLFAWIMMPRGRHEKSRKMFVNEARKMKQIEFIKWFELSKDVVRNHYFVHKHKLKVPSLTIMGDEDYMFLPFARKYSGNSLNVIKKSGHVCNVDAFKEFNEICIDFINKHKL